MSTWEGFKKPVYWFLLTLFLLNTTPFLWKSIRKEGQGSLQQTLNQLIDSLRNVSVENVREKMGSPETFQFSRLINQLTLNVVFPRFDNTDQHKRSDDVDASGTNSHSSELRVTKNVKDDKPKSSKERFNYASFDCAAAVLKSNSEAKGATAILNESKDQYMWNECTAERHVIVELCDDILIDTVALSNYEFFSSIFKDLRISVSNRYPPKDNSGWKILGEFQARNIRDVQVFHISNPLIWARYIRIDFLSHYGNEFICPVSLLRVHGTTMMEEYKREDDELLSEASNALSSEVINSKSIIQHTLPALKPEDALPLPKIQAPPLSNFDVIDSEVKNIIDIGSFQSLHPHPSGSNSIEDETVQSVSTSTPAQHESRQSYGSHTTPPGGTQESIFKTITKRLNILEQNMALSYKYFSEQSNTMNEIFANIDASQKQHLWNALVSLNNTAMSQLNILRSTYELVWQTTLLESKTYRTNTDEEIRKITHQIHILADEVLFEKRLGAIQLVLLCVLIVIVGASNLFKDPFRIIKKGKVD
ncbi:hypothetical protein K7432_003870 [Basidiobolus ranarum]|uniref:SUN domain-containing protein n=1 Tax=Basidiobolus ranarum TaxID=34480 RepID=A0ABR2W5H2_9FUNG